MKKTLPERVKEALELIHTKLGNGVKFKQFEDIIYLAEEDGKYWTVKHIHHENNEISYFNSSQTIKIDQNVNDFYPLEKWTDMLEKTAAALPQVALTPEELKKKKIEDLETELKALKGKDE